MKVSIVIPTKDEPYIGELVKQIHKVMSDHDFEVIVVEKNNISLKVNGAKVVIQKSEGLGNAVLEGLEHTKGDVIVIMDGDGSHKVRDITNLLKQIDDYDIVIGSRFVKGGRTYDKVYRNFVSLLYRKFASFLLGLNIKDNMSGFSAVKKDVFRHIKLKPLGYKINLEIIYKASKKGFTTVEVPIVFLSRKRGKSKTNLKVGFEILRHIIELRLGLR